MWRSLRLISREYSAISRRTFLSEAYALNSEWERRLTTPLLQKVNNESLFADLSQKFQHKKKINAIDVDIYANKADQKHVEEALDLLQKLRTTSQAMLLLDSTQHAIVRLLLTNTDLLLSILNHRLENGIFLDDYTANLVLDKLIKEKNFMAAARVATLQMLQEDFEHPLTRFLSLFACYKFLENLETFHDLLPPAPPQEEQAAGAPATPAKKKKVEEVKIRVPYLRNEFFDDHFDITNSNHLLGKTFLYLSDAVRADDDVLANSLNLLGYSLYEKYEDGGKFVEGAQKLNFYKEIVDRVKAFAEKAENLDENGQKFFDSLNNIASLKDGNVEEIIASKVKEVVKSREAADIEAQKKIFESWIEVRQQQLDDEIIRMQRIQRLEEIERKQEEMNREEKKLWFFEKEEEIKMEIEGKKRYYPKRWFGKKSKPKKLHEDYIPPEVESITRSRLAK